MGKRYHDTYHPPRELSKARDRREEEARPLSVFVCAGCKRQGVTLMKAPDGYMYCKACRMLQKGENMVVDA